MDFIIDYFYFSILIYIYICFVNLNQRYLALQSHVETLNPKPLWHERPQGGFRVEVP